MEVQLTWGAQPESTTASDDADTTPDTGSSGNQYRQDDLNDLFRYFFGSRGYGG